jgi:hypothetical protein
MALIHEAAPGLPMRIRLKFVIPTTTYDTAILVKTRA